MFSLQVQIRNLSPAPSVIRQLAIGNQPIPLTIRFGPLQSDISMFPHPGNAHPGVNNQGPLSVSGGKKLLLEMDKKQMDNLMAIYAFGIFMQNLKGKFWAILSLQKLSVGQCHQCKDMVLYNDDRNVCYTFQLFIKLEHFNPRVPKNIEQNQQSSKYPGKQPISNQNKIKSFLYGKKNSEVIQTLKPPQPVQKRQSQNDHNTNRRNGSMKKENKVAYAVAAHVPPQSNNYVGTYPETDDENGIYIPPVMQFVNYQQPQYQLKQPVKKQPEYNNLVQNDHRQTVYNNKNQGRQGKRAQTVLQAQPKTLPKFQTFMDYSQFREHTKPHSQKNIGKQQISKQQLRQMARKQAEAMYQQKQNQILIPVPDPITGAYKLVPLTSMSEAQILQYAEKQKMAQQYKKLQQMQKIKNKKKEEKRKKKQMYVGKIDKSVKNQLKKQKIGVSNNKQRISQKNKQSSSSESQSDISQQQKIAKKSKKMSKINQNKQDNSNENLDSEEQDQYDEYRNSRNQEQNEQQNEDEQNYQSDFQSISNAGSLIKSRKSLQSSISLSHEKQKQKSNQKNVINNLKNKVNEGKESNFRKTNEYEYSQSMDDYGYSQDFDSFSQSLISRNNGKRAGSSISQISGDYGGYNYNPKIINSNRK